MKLGGLIKREVHWWKSHLSITLSFPLLVVVMTLTPQALFHFSGYRFEDIRASWESLSSMFNHVVMNLINSSPLYKMLFGELIKQAESFFSLPFDQVFQKYLLLPLQMWLLLPLSMLIPPMVVEAFKKDRDNGVFLYYRWTGGKALKFLFAKFVVLAIYYLVVQVLSYFLYLQAWSYLTSFPAFFRFGDWDWLYMALLSYALCILCLAVCWLFCLCSKNGKSEHYVAQLMVAFVIALLFAILSKQSLSFIYQCLLLLVIIGIALSCLAATSIRMQSSKYFY